MIFTRKCQISIIEYSFVILLIITGFGYLYNSYSVETSDYKFTVESLLDSVYYSEDYRNIIMDEDLTNINIIQDWSSLLNLLEENLGKFELVISNDSNEKVLALCNETTTKIFSERIISIKDNSNFEFRKIKLGVCY